MIFLKSRLLFIKTQCNILFVESHRFKSYYGLFFSYAMNLRFSLLAAVSFFFCTVGLYAQFGVRVGVNMANEITTFEEQANTNAFSTSRLNGDQIGLVYQLMSPKSGVGFEIGALLSQKGCAFNDTLSTTNIISQGYRELSYLEMPLSLRYKVTVGFVGIYAFGGVYGGYLLSAKTVNEITEESQNQESETFVDKLDYGYTFGGGIEAFNKIQLGATMSNGVKDNAYTVSGIPTPLTVKNKVFSINFVYLF